MPNDITTLAIEIQSQEAERNLKSFYEMMTAASQTAGKMEKVSISMDAGQAIAQLRELRTVYEEIAAAGSKIAFDLPQVPNVAAAPEVDTSSLAELKAFFSQNLELSQALREEMANFNAELEKIDAQSAKVATSHGGAESGARSAAAAHGEYAATLREVAKAQKEYEAAAAKAEEASIPAIAASQDAAAVKKRLTQAQRELASVSKRLAATNSIMRDDVVALAEKEEYLKNKVAELKKVYEEAAAAADKLNQKMEDATEKAGGALYKYQELKSKLDAMPAPVERFAQKTEDFSVTARGAATQATKMARGFNAVAYSAGASIPELNKVGQIIGTFATGGPIIGGIVVGVGALAAGIKYLWDESQRGYKLTHEYAVQSLADARSMQSGWAESGKGWDRLGNLASVDAMTAEQHREAVSLIEAMTEAYGKLGIEIDRTTGRLTGYAHAREAATAAEREIAIMAAERALNTASDDFENEKKNIGGGKLLKKTQFDTIKARFQEMSGLSDVEQLKYLMQWQAHVQDVARGKQNYRWKNENGEWTEGARMISDDHIETVGSGNAQEEADYVKTLIDKYKQLIEAKKIAGKVKGQDTETYNRQVEALEKQRKKLAEGVVVDSSGNARLKTQAELYQEQQMRLAEIARIQNELRGKDPTAVSDDPEAKGKKNGVYLAELEVEKQRLLNSTLKYEERITQEKERQTKAQQAQLEALKKRFVIGSSGDIIRQKNSAEIAAERNAKIDTLFWKIKDLEERRQTETDPAKRSAYDKDIGKAQFERQQLQVERLRDNDAREAAKKQFEAGRKNYVYDKQGNIVREKTKREKDLDLAKEIEAAEAKVKAAPKGSKEYYQAMQELDRLKQEQFKRRRNDSLGNLGFSQKQAHNNMVQGLSAKSSQALQLQTRNFSKPDNAWKTLDKTQNQIYNTVSGFATDISSIANAAQTLNNNLVNL